jgi:hypothetical protein
MKITSCGMPRPNNKRPPFRMRGEAAERKAAIDFAPCAREQRTKDASVAFGSVA